MAALTYNHTTLRTSILDRALLSFADHLREWTLRRITRRPRLERASEARRDLQATLRVRP